MVDTTDAWIVERTGIRERRIAGKGETTFSLGLAAATGALEVAKLEGGDVDLVVVATLTPEFGVPATASLIQEAIGASSAGAFDINAACAGFVYAMSVAKGLIESGAHRNVLIVGSDTMSRIVDWTDRSTCVLFGDGAGAVVMQASDRPGGIQSVALGSDGAGAELLYVPAGGSRTPATTETVRRGMHYLAMDGREVYRFAVKATARAARDVMGQAGLTADDVDLFIPHQANTRIIASAARSLGLPDERVFMNVERYGNTAAGSVPIALCEAIEQGRVKPGDQVVLVGVGGGLAWAAAAMEWTAATPGEPTAVRVAESQLATVGGGGSRR